MDTQEKQELIKVRAEVAHQVLRALTLSSDDKDLPGKMFLDEKLFRIWNECESMIAQDATSAYQYAYMAKYHKIAHRFLAGEAAIAEDGALALKYADAILEAPFPRGEREIFKDAERAYEYARKFDYHLPPEAEREIAKDAYYAYLYAKYHLKGPFQAGEATIAADPDLNEAYQTDVVQPALEKDNDGLGFSDEKPASGGLSP